MAQEADSGPGGDRDVLDRLRRALAGRYDIVGEVGEGAMGTVLAADDRKHGRRVAIKVTNQRLVPGSDDRFRREIAIAAQLSHPHIVPLHDSGVADGLAYYVMPFVDGETLRDRLEREGALPVERALAIARDVAQALDHAHAHGIVHRDVKPANILLSSGHALVADFGVARALEAASLRDVTATGGVGIGSPAYMSPEQALGDAELDGRADVYALGCVVYEMLSGERPYEAGTPLAMVARHVHEEVPCLPPGDAVPPAMSEAVRRAMAKKPGERFATAGAFADALEEGGLSGARTGRASPRTGRRLGAAAAAVVGVAVVAALLVLTDSSTPADGRYRSLAVLPFETPGSTPDDRSAAADLAAAIGVELNSWDSVRAVPRVALAGPMFDLGLDGPTVPTVDAGLRIARALGVQAMLSVHAVVRGDSVEVEANLFDARTGRELRRPMTLREAGSSPDLARRVAWTVLGIDPADHPADAGRRTSDREALRAFARGDRSLERWRLGEAQRAYREAVARDSGFALAYHRLAQALYWEAAEGPRSLQSVGPEIARLSALAVRESHGLPSRDSLHIRAFHAFQLGDYETARAGYRELLAMDPTDVYAWLMLGSTEYRDHWLVEGPEGLVPRADLGQAIRAFEETLRLQPTFELGYGHLFDIHGLLALTAHGGGCGGFERPRDEFLAPWDDEPPDRQVAFCAVVDDSVRWVPSEELATLDEHVLEEAADRLFRQSLRMLRRWAAFAPDQPRPHETLAEVLLRKRASMGLAGPAEIEGLAREARDALAAALSLRPDPEPERLYRLATLHLASGEPGRALALADSLADRHDGPPPPEVANVYLATGRVGDALEALAGIGFTWYIEREDGSGLVPYAGGEPLVLRILALAGLTEGSGRLVRMLDSLDARWAEAGLDNAARSLLRGHATGRIMPALAADSAARAAWARKVEVDDPGWIGLAGPEPDSARAAALVERVLEDGPSATGAFVAGHVALRGGAPVLAARSFARPDSVAFGVGAADAAWGLRALGAYWRGRAHEASSDTAAAVDAYNTFRERWFAADDLAVPLVRDASDRIERLGRHATRPR